MKHHMYVLAVLSAGLGMSQAAPVAAGTTIKNQVGFSAQAQGTPIQSGSNIAFTNVAQLCSVNITPNGTPAAYAYSASILPTESTTLRYVVKNTGNTPATIPLTAQSSAGMAQTALYLDNGDGTYTQADQSINSVTLPAGQQATVWLRVTAVAGAAIGAAADVNLIGDCGNQTDNDNLSHITVGTPPTLQLTKRFGATDLRPGEQTSVTVDLKNTSANEAHAVVLSDPLATQIAAGLNYISGSARTNMGTLEYTADTDPATATWSATEPANVRGVRVRLDNMAAAADMVLAFTVQASAQAEAKTFTNVASATTTAATVPDASAVLKVHYNPAVAIGPLNNAQAMGTADAQSVPFASTDQPTCFDHTVTNTGDIADTFSLSVSGTQAGVTYQDAGGQPLAQPFALAVGASTTVKVCYTPTAAQSGQVMNAKVTVSGTRGTSDPTLDTINLVGAQAPSLKKTVALEGNPTWTTDTGRVKRDDVLVYTLSVTNPYSTPLHDVVVSDQLPADTAVLASGTTAGYTQSGRTLSWSLPTLPPGETRITVRAAVAATTTDDEVLNNQFTMQSAEFTKALPSNTVSTYVWNSIPQIFKKAAVTQVAFGDQVPYTVTLKNISSSSPIVDVKVTDTPAKGLVYIAGTSMLDGKPLGDPVVVGDSLVWTVDKIDANGERELTYEMRVTPDAIGTELVNSVEMEGRGASGKVRAVASAYAAKVKVNVNLLNFAPKADILGEVYVDNDGNGVVSDHDLPISGARVILAGGRISLTDAKGRYHFSNVPLGTHALRLDPASVPYASEEDSPATRTVHVNGLTSVNFPLQPNAGSAAQSVHSQQGAVSIDKSVQSVPGGYAVHVTLTTPKALQGVSLTDALPAGAQLSTGHNALSGDLPAGTSSLDYTYQFGGNALLSPPTVTWKD